LIERRDERLVAWQALRGRHARAKAHRERRHQRTRDDSPWIHGVTSAGLPLWVNPHSRGCDWYFDALSAGVDAAQAALLMGRSTWRTGGLGVPASPLGGPWSLWAKPRTPGAGATRSMLRITSTEQTHRFPSRGEGRQSNLVRPCHAPRAILPPGSQDNAGRQ